jgi:hypothetical protein
MAKLELMPSPFPDPQIGQYILTSGTVTVTVSGQTPDGCTISGNTTVPLIEGLDSIELELLDPPPSYQLTIAPAGEQIVLISSGCDNPAPPSDVPLVPVAFAQTTTPIARDPAATTLEDTIDAPEAPGQPATHSHWKLSL